MCEKCIPGHEEIHDNLRLGSVVAVPINDVANDCEKYIDEELGMIENEGRVIPEELVYRMIDWYFFGSSLNRDKVLHSRK